MKKFIIGFLVGAVLFSALGVIAATFIAEIAPFKVFVNGNEFVGTTGEILVVEGRTYLPLRDMGNALGIAVNWNEKLGQVEVGTPPQAITDPLPNNPIDNLLQAGSVITFGGIDITYNGYYEAEVDSLLITKGKTKVEHFTIKNNNDVPVRVLWNIVGVKKDGTDEMLLSSVFSAFDKEQYDKDFKENGWAIEKQTADIAANSTMKTEVKFISPFASKEDLDVDKDGYYDIKFTVTLIKDGYISSANMYTSDIYKILANE